jgi:hypothetical protein
MNDKVTVASTLDGLVALLHPIQRVFCREDGQILVRKQGYFARFKPYEIPHHWTSGASCPGYEGYKTCSIRGKSFRAHRIICEAFHANPDNKPTVDHINRVRDDNRPANLRFATYKEQKDNSDPVLNRLPYSVRQCENRPQYDKEYRLDHLEEKRKYDKEYKARNRDKQKEQNRIWRIKNREQYNANACEYRRTHPEYCARMYFKSKINRLSRIINSELDEYTRLEVVMLDAIMAFTKFTNSIPNKVSTVLA